jgi:hypothetical protein
MENQNQPTSEPTTGTHNPFKPDLSRVSAEYLIAEIYRRQRAGECVALIITPSDLSEYWECDDSGATHPGSRVPEAGEMHAIGKAFERWQDSGSGSEIMEVCRDAWQAEQARQLDKGDVR